MKKTIIIGGGLSGLSAAVHLIKKNISPIIIEASPKTGGRASSHFDKDFSGCLDNGQHILMGCYFNTLDFMHTVQAEDNLVYQDNLHADLVDEAGNNTPLSAGELVYPFNTLRALLNYEAVPLRKRIQCAAFFVKCVMLYRGVNPSGLTVSRWLEVNGQGRKIQRALWDFLSIGALNTSPDKADALLFRDMLRQIFLRGNSAQTIILPKYDLSKTFCEPAEKYIAENSGGIKYAERLLSMQVEDGIVKTIVTNKETYNDFSDIILALPPYILQHIDGVPMDVRANAGQVQYSSILTFHLKLTDNQLTKPFYGLIGSPLHWVFNHGGYITTVMSNADEYINTAEDELFRMIKSELRKYLKISPDKIQSYKLIQEKKATFVPSSEQLKLRPRAATSLANLFLAGDWVQNGLPATIEGAILNGKNAAKLVYL
jgi:squalene-associated FAD-dependent desaturase